MGSISPLIPGALERVIVDARGLRLGGADLSGMMLRRAELYGAVLSEAILMGANLRGADLRKVTLARADMTGADTTGADFRHANLRDVIGLVGQRDVAAEILAQRGAGIARRDGEAAAILALAWGLKRHPEAGVRGVTDDIHGAVEPDLARRVVALLRAHGFA